MGEGLEGWHARWGRGWKDDVLGGRRGWKDGMLDGGGAGRMAC